MKVLVTGGKGRLGSLLTEIYTAQDGYDVLSVDIDEIDIASYSDVFELVTLHNPNLVVHCAAWTDVDGCAREPEKAMAIYGYGAGNVAAAAYEVGAPIIHVSSNEVFAGDRSTLYYEHDATGPVNSYGYSKYVGEQEVVRLNPKHMIVRTSWLFAHGGKNFMQTMINAANAGKNLRVVTNEVAHPTYTNDLAAAIVSLGNINRPGTYHIVNEGAVSRWTFARYILDRAGHRDTHIAKISSVDWPRPSTPPEYTHLANTAAKHLGVTLRPWQDAVDAFLHREGLLVDDE
ncbi:MAG: dTDP-4-dehydrorhamnose reductase [Chloroflexota bacterium]